MSSWSDSDESTFPESWRNVRNTEREEFESGRKRSFENNAAAKTDNIFHLPGLKITQFTHKRIDFTFRPSEIYSYISETYLFCCKFRYMELHRKWMIKKEPIPTLSLIPKVTSGEIFLDDHSIPEVIFKMYCCLREVSEEEIIYRHEKFERYKVGLLSDLYIDSIDAELYLTNRERDVLFEKREKIRQRMLPPTPKPKRQRKFKK